MKVKTRYEPYLFCLTSLISSITSSHPEVFEFEVNKPLLVILMGEPRSFFCCPLKEGDKIPLRCHGEQCFLKLEFVELQKARLRTVWYLWEEEQIFKVQQGERVVEQREESGLDKAVGVWNTTIVSGTQRLHSVRVKSLQHYCSYSSSSLSSSSSPSLMQEV